jgi:LytS/YehU family sensor histidine kinase
MMQKDSQKASEALLKLSDVMRYQLYEPAAEKICLGKEIKNISNYIELEKIRREDNVKLQLDIPANASDYMIHPYILMPLVENAFKHLSRYENRLNTVGVALKLDKDILDVEVVNSKENNCSPVGSGGIGIKNLKRRLELLYKDKHELKIEEGKEYYKVNLKLNSQ